MKRLVLLITGRSMMARLAASVTGIALLLSLSSAPMAQTVNTIDFETVPGGTPTEGLHINTQFDVKQQAFLDFVLQHYVSVGVEELDQEKLTPLLRLKYHDSIADAVADLGRPEEIGTLFAGFQKYLYQQAIAA